QCWPPPLSHGSASTPAWQTESTACERNRRDQRFRQREGISGKTAAVGERQTKKNPWQAGDSASRGRAGQTSARPECRAPESTPKPGDSCAKSNEGATEPKSERRWRRACPSFARNR